MPCYKRVNSSNDSSSSGKENTGVQLKKNIGVIQGISIIVGAIIGSGIFVSPIGVLANSNSVGMSFVVWILCGGFSLLGSLVYAELGVTIPHSGGEYIYILKTFGPMLAFMCLWITFVIIGAVSLAANGLMFAEYVVKPFFLDCSTPISVKIIIAMFGLLSLAFVNCYNVKWATKVSVVFTVGKIAALLCIIGIGCYNLFFGRVESFQEPFQPIQDNYGGFAMAFFQGFWAFAGWNYLNFLVDEMKNPAKNLPLAIIISLAIVTIVYLCANVAYLTVLSPLEIISISKNSIAVAVVFAEKTMGPFAIIMPVCVGASVFGSMNGEFLSNSRLTYVAAKEGHLLKAFGMVSYKYLTPMPAVILLSICATVFAFTPSVNYLIQLASFAFCVTAGLAVLCLIYLRIKFPKVKKSFQLPLFFHFLFILCTLFICCLTVYDAPMDALYSILMMLIGIPIYIIFIVWKNKPKSIIKFTEAFTYFIQKLLLVVPEDEKIIFD